MRIIEERKKAYEIVKALYDFLMDIVIDIVWLGTISIVLSNLHLEGEPIAICQSDGLCNCTSSSEVQFCVTTDTVVK